MKIKFIPLILLATLFVLGLQFRNDSEYETFVIHEVLRPKETVDEVVRHWYNYQKENRSLDEFLYDNITVRNKVLFLNGRCPQAGDIICIEIHQKK